MLTHDVSTMTRYAYQRIRAGQSIAGIIEVSQAIPVGRVIEDLVTIVSCSSPEEFENQIQYLPL